MLSSPDTFLIPINYLLNNIIRSLQDEWISECDELCQILQQPHLVSLLNVVDCVARQIFDVKNIDDDKKILYNDQYSIDDKNKFTNNLVYLKKRKLPCQKIINVIKSHEPLGVTVRFDDITGDPVLARVLVGGAAYRSGLANVGDKILEVNGIPLRGRSHLDVINILQKECLKTMITFKILTKNKQYDYDTIRSFIVKAHFDYDPQNDPLLPCPKIGLAFDRGSILNILNRDDCNWWQASKETESSNKSRMEVFQIAGLIPSKSLQERRIVAIRDIKSQLDRYRYISILGGLLPLPFKKSKWSTQKIKKIMYDLNDCIKYDREEIFTYEPVAKYFPRPEFCRPIILIGPSGIGCSLLVNLLCNYKPDHYREPLAHTSRFKRFQENENIDYYFVSEEWMEQEIKIGNFICYTKHRGNYYGIHKQTIRQIIDAGYVCVFKIDARFLRLIHTSEFKPYVIFIRPPYDIEKLIELKQDLYLTMNNEYKSRQLLEYEMHLIIYEAHKLYLIYGHKFDTIIINENMKKTFEKFYETVIAVENNPTWIPITWTNKHDL